MYQPDSELGSHPLTTAIRRALKAGATAAVLAAVSAPWIGVAQAQEAAPERQEAPVARRSIEEVMVTARRREESAQTVPIAIDVFSTEKLQDFRVERMEDLKTLAPSLSVSTSSGRTNSPVYSLRGVRPTEALYGQDPTVAIYFADVVLAPAKGSNLGMYDLGSVQVLKGPQGTLFGRNTTGGAILLAPQRPGDVVGGEVMVGYGNYGRNETQFAFDLPTTDNFALRFSGRSKESDGWQTNVADNQLNGEKYGGGTERSGRITTVWNISDRLQNDTILTWDDMNLDGRALVLEAVNPALAGRFGYEPAASEALARQRGRSIDEIETDMLQTSEVDVWGIFNTTTFDISDGLTLKNILGYRDFKATEVIDLDATAIPGWLSSNQTATLQHGSWEVQLLGKAFEDRLDWVTGLYWYYEDGVEDSPGFALAGSPLILRPHAFQTSDMTNNSYSAFAQGSFHLTDHWTVTGGVRWTYDEKEMTTSNLASAADGSLLRCSMLDAGGNRFSVADCAVKQKESFNQPTGTVSVEYAPTEDMLFYLASRYGYRAGGFNARGNTPTEQQPFDPETVTDLELGAKIDWYVGDWGMRSNIAVYQQWYDDIQRTVGIANPDGLPGSAVQNAAKAKIFGIEIEQVIAPTENLSFTISYVYTDPEYEEWDTLIAPNPLIPAVLASVDISDTPFHFTPEHAASVTATYTYPLSGNAGTLRFAAGASYQDDVWINSLQTSFDMASIPQSVYPTMQQDAYWLYDASASWNGILGSALDLSAYVKNLTDEEYTVGGIQLYHRVGLNNKAYGDPRTYGVQFRYKF